MLIAGEEYTLMPLQSILPPGYGTSSFALLTCYYLQTMDYTDWVTWLSDNDNCM
jgi:hypothetical protein